MRIGPLSFSVSVFVAIAASGLSARADVPPADQCTAPGQPCQNAGAVTGPGQPGTCVAATCIKTMRSADGGFTYMPYDCHRCEAPDGGTTGGGGAAGAAGGTAGAAGGTAGAAGGTAGATATGGTIGSGGSSSTGGTGSKTMPGSSSGCAVAGLPARRGAAAGALSLALLTILLRRRRTRA
ncbi:MAG: hypothetical protein ACJ8F1_03280 [Polyangia bacterium]